MLALPPTPSPSSPSSPFSFFVLFFLSFTLVLPPHLVIFDSFVAFSDPLEETREYVCHLYTCSSIPQPLDTNLTCSFLNLSMDCVVLLVFCLAAKKDTVEERNFCDGVMDGQDWARDLGFRSEGRKGLGERGIVVDGWEVDSSFFFLVL